MPKTKLKARGPRTKLNAAPQSPVDLPKCADDADHPISVAMKALGPAGKAVVSRYFERSEKKTPPPKLGINDAKISLATEKVTGTLVLVDVFGTTDDTFSNGLVHQLASLGAPGRQATEAELNFMLSIVRGIDPKDETEALLATQMAAIHNAMLVAARRLGNVDNIPQQDSASTMLNKLARTFAMQLEALKRYRSTGEQTVRVQHVTVNDGGQAIVAGEMAAGGGVQKKEGGQPHGPSEGSERSPSLLSKI